MGKAGGGAAWVRGLAGGLPMLALLAGCGHRDAVDTPLTWWHGLQGGAIAQQRPPPPGVDDPYPRVGTTPAKAPEVASLDLRRSVTAQLVEQRNLSARLNAHDPLPPPVVVPPKAATPPPAATAPAAPAAAQSSATLDAAEAPPPPPAVPAAPQAATAPHGQAAAAVVADEPALAMPDVVPAAAGADAGAVALPPIPAAPPPSPGLPGIAMPPPPSYAPPPRPQYALAQPPGDLLRFAVGSDTLESGQSGALHALALRRGAGSVFVHGYGDSTSDAPQDQAQALTLAALRARSVADALEREGVPASAIRIRADAFGRGATAGLID